ncbi:hypothetical protein [Streptomyces naphthomycinicus]|uniref:hypothetical protein n=1 Tax=Streptomyces naphthomycinicus TaxID=2872625 RepID=UPI001CEC7A2F|nr:hypothetical protein [Streptomyces sp. TML10]
MRRLQQAAVAAAVIGSIGFAGASPATAQAAQSMRGGGGGCDSHDMNIDILGEVGILNGLGGNLLNGEGNPGAQYTDMGSDCR